MTRSAGATLGLSSAIVEASWAKAEILQSFPDTFLEIADKGSMGSISGIAGSLLQQGIFQSSGVSGNVSTSSAGLVSGAPDDSRLSPLGKVLSELQTLQQTDPAKYKDVTGEIAVKLQSAADADTAAGNTAGAAQLAKLAADFTTASASGKLPDVQDLAKAIGGEHHHHHGHHGGKPPAEIISGALPSSG